MPQEAEKKVFISYAYPRDTLGERTTSSKSDRKVAEQICFRLESTGIDCWIAPRDIPPGKRWLEAMIEGINQCRILIVVFSAATNLSNWVTDEVTLALEHEITIIPFKIENVSPRGALEVLQVRCQWFNAYTPPLENHIDRLVFDIRKILKLPDIEIDKKRGKEAPGQGPKRRNRLLRWIAAAALIITFIGTAYIIQGLLTHKSKPDISDKKSRQTDVVDLRAQDDRDFEVASRENTVPAYETYMEEYPEGRYVAEARTRITELNVEAIKDTAIAVYKTPGGQWEAEFPDGIAMVFIPAGPFTMGSNEGDENEQPPHEVNLKGYWMGKFEVTFAQYDMFCDDIHRKKPSDRGWGRGRRPVIDVSWEDAVAYCRWLSRKMEMRFILPTEAQWEKAARGRDGRRFPWGDHQPEHEGTYYANYRVDSDGFSRQTAPVGEYPQGASPYGLMDMAGNVMEWCANPYSDKYSPESTPPQHKGPPGDAHFVVRGGNWTRPPFDIRCTRRLGFRPQETNETLGFRLCLEVE